MMAAIAWRAPSDGPIGFSLASMWMPWSEGANFGMAACARCASVTNGSPASAEEAAAARRKLRREIPPERECGETGNIIDGTPYKWKVGWRSTAGGNAQQGRAERKDCEGMKMRSMSHRSVERCEFQEKNTQCCAIPRAGPAPAAGNSVKLPTAAPRNERKRIFVTGNFS